MAPRSKKTNKLIIILVSCVAVACVLSLGILVNVDGPEIITEHVSHLKVEQNETQLDLSWDSVECEEYIIWLASNGKRVEYRTTDCNFEIEHITLGEKYKVSVRGVYENGHITRSTSKKIHTQKQSQKLSAKTEQYEGFSGEKFKINAKAKEEISYSSSDSKIAEVSDNGTVVLRGSGHADIKVTAAESGVYAEETMSVSVDVYPEELSDTTLRSKKVKASRVVLSWKAVDFATGYELFKYNIEKDEFESKGELKTETKGDNVVATITRDAGSYKVKAYGDLKDRHIEGKLSNSVEIKGAAAKAKAYSSSHTIARLNSSNLERVATIRGAGKINVPQSISCTGNRYVVAYVNKGGSQGRLIEYTRDGKVVAVHYASGIGYANGSTYNPNSNRIYTVRTHKGTKSPLCTTFNGKTFEPDGTFNLPKNASGIAYDESNNKYYITKGNEIYVLDSQFNKEKFIWKKIRYNHAQDVGAYNGVALVCTWVKGNTSYIDLYRVSDGAYLGSFDVSIGEIESVLVDDGYLVILMNTRGSSTDYIYRTTERVDLL